MVRFKKPKQKNKNNARLRKRQTDDDNDNEHDNDKDNNEKNENKNDKSESSKTEEKPNKDKDNDEEEEPSALEAIAQAKKRLNMRQRLLYNTSGTSIGTTSTDNANDDAAKRKKILLMRRRRQRAGLLNNDNDEDEEENQDGEQNQEEEEGADTANPDLMERLEGTFSAGVSGNAGPTDAAGPDGVIHSTGVLGQKHRQAMEDYIQTRLGHDKNNNDSDDTKKKKKNTGGGEDDLYAELTSQVITGGEDAAGNPMSSSSRNSPTPSSKNPSATTASTAAEDAATREGDVGAGGAMLGGTGIAEVALPLDERVGAIQRAERAAMAKSAGKHTFKSRPAFSTTERLDVEVHTDATAALPMQFASGPAKKKQKHPSTLDNPKSLDLSLHPSSKPAPFVTTTTEPPPSSTTDTTPSYYSASSAGEEVLRSDVSHITGSYAHNFQMHNSQWASRKRKEREEALEKSTLQKEKEGGEDGQRKGFAVLRGRVQENGGEGEGGGGGGERREWKEQDKKKKGEYTSNHRSSDDRVWQSFVTRQRERSGKRFF